MNMSQANMLIEKALTAYQNGGFSEAEELWGVAGMLC
jgi:hypothetical protein